MKQSTIALALLLAGAAWVAFPATASNHREAPITALDHKADIADFYAFRSPDARPDDPKVTLILDVDPLLEPGNGPTLFPFDPDVLYEIHVDNDHDALADLTFQFRFSTEYRLPDVYTAVAGFGDFGANAPGTNDLVVPPRITDFQSPGLNQRQTYTVHVMNVSTGSMRQIVRDDGMPFYAVPGNPGARTMDYAALYDEGTVELSNGISLFAGTVDDPFYIDLGAAFDTANFRTLASGVPGVLTDTEDQADTNGASDTVSGYAVNAIAIELPVKVLTSTGMVEPADAPAATIGAWATTSRHRITIRQSPDPAVNFDPFRQVQRLGNPLINELIIGMGSKDRYSMEQPVNDAQFAGFFLDPPIVRIVEALYGGALSVPSAPRTDLLPLVTYAPPIAAPGTPAGPVADLLRLNTGVPPTAPGAVSRLGLIGGDPAGYPNGRRLVDDVVDITLRVGVGGVLAGPFPGYTAGVNDRLGDGVNVNDAALRPGFPFLAHCPSGRDRRHVDPGEPGGGPVQ